jgi:cell division protein FtsB
MNYLVVLTEKYPLIKNKYFLVLLVFLIWVTFIDKNNLISQYQDRQVLYELDKEKRYYQIEIQTTQDKLNELKTDNRSIEKFAREKYLMKKENEEIWLVVDKSVKSE